MNTYTVVAICCCGCDKNEIHILEADSAEEAAKHIAEGFGLERRIVAVFDGAHTEARTQA